MERIGNQGVIVKRSETGRITHDDIELIYELTGTGDPVVLIHASPFVGWYAPLVEQMPDFAILRYHRRVQPAEPGMIRPLTVAEDAALCVQLMDRVGWQVAHVAGHSYGALVALGLALDNPGRVRTLVLLEPAARGISSNAQVVTALDGRW
jgi:pimeloyl-ACP methyl ester carboxylesterase